MNAFPVNGTYDISSGLLDYTYAYNRYSCITWVYPIHIACAYALTAAGLLALLSRVIVPLKTWHSLFGRLYLIFMFWCMGSSLLIHNAGIPFPIIVSFLYLLGGITIGWLAIYWHIRNMDLTLWHRVQIATREALMMGQTDLDLQLIRQQELGKIVNQKTFTQRFFSLKTVHGMFLTFSWCQMAGRLVVTNPGNQWHGCWTYPAYKNPTGMAVFINATQPGYFPIGEPAFILATTLPFVAVIVLTALLVSYCAGRAETKRRETVGAESARTMSQLKAPVVVESAAGDEDKFAATTTTTTTTTTTETAPMPGAMDTEAKTEY